MYCRLRGSSYIRLAVDTVLEKSMFVYRYLSDHLLSFAQEEVPLTLTKRVLKDTLRGLAELHSQNFVHAGKPGRRISSEQ
jgi:hypothetical protein